MIQIWTAKNKLANVQAYDTSKYLANLLIDGKHDIIVINLMSLVVSVGKKS